MSITYTADVFCDGKDCSAWTYGAHQHEKPPPKTEARRNMRDGFKHINGKDFCRACAKKEVPGGS